MQYVILHKVAIFLFFGTVAQKWISSFGTCQPRVSVLRGFYPQGCYCRLILF